MTRISFLLRLTRIQENNKIRIIYKRLIIALKQMDEIYYTSFLSILINYNIVWYSYLFTLLEFIHRMAHAPLSLYFILLCLGTKKLLQKVNVVMPYAL